MALVLNGFLIFVAIRPLFEEVADSLAGEIAALRLAMRISNPAQRSQQAQSLSLAGTQFHKDEGRAARRVVGDAAERPSEHPFLDRLHGALGPGVDLALIHRDDRAPTLQLQAAFDIDGERWVLDLPEPHASSREPLWTLLVALGFAGLVPLLAMVAGIRWITRPMAKVAREVADRHEHLRPLDVDQPVGSELQEIITSFNGLVQSVTASDEARRNMLAGVSHDLRTPLARLRLRAELECTPETARAMEVDCDALGRIIDQFLAYAQGEAGVSLGVAEPLAELIRQIESQYEGRGVKVEMPNEVVGRLTYPDLAIWRIVTNLVDNAIAHGKLPVTVTVDADDAECRFIVRDAGRGIRPVDLEHAFKPFAKLRATNRDSRDEVGHCGLGLAIVAQICAELRGRAFDLPFNGKTSGVGVALPRIDATTDEEDNEPAGWSRTMPKVYPAALT
jgi:two-component system osmolarity sensor histidine kinase EnvZ